MCRTVACFAASMTLLSPPAIAGELLPLTQACEEALALSAMPAALRERANVYVWRNGAYERTVESDGGFHCLVERNHPRSLIPECVTPSGADSVLPALMFKTSQALSGKSPTEIQKAFVERFDDGDFFEPSAPGINYMMSNYNYIYSERAGALLHVPPHTMFFAPGVSNEDVGGSMQRAMSNKGTPFVVDSGPHGYMVTFTETASESGDVERHCEGQLEAPPKPLG